jgi:hypothetical protein
MNNIVSAFAKFCACTAFVIGAPLIAANAINFTVMEIQEELNYQTCVDAERLNRIGTKCVR